MTSTLHHSSSVFVVVLQVVVAAAGGVLVIQWISSLGREHTKDVFCSQSFESIAQNIYNNIIVVAALLFSQEMALLEKKVYFAHLFNMLELTNMAIFLLINCVYNILVWCLDYCCCVMMIYRQLLRCLKICHSASHSPLHTAHKLERTWGAKCAHCLVCV